MGELGATNLSSRTLKSDRIFVVPATSVFVLGLFVAAWDFVQLQKAVWSLGVLNGLGLAMFVGGTILRAVGKRTLGRFYFMD